MFEVGVPVVSVSIRDAALMPMALMVLPMDATPAAAVVNEFAGLCRINIDPAGWGARGVDCVDPAKAGTAPNVRIDTRIPVSLALRRGPSG
jgi:hypothetical protein